ncbi:YetF domain-containing protein [Nocardioides sp. CER19]|uniref:DUF421 domain-containing protein n=1 Tax=Nocardioides sp. CER19 TaxID=3038538 RepID=UPI00244BA632|nr:YetF domain-containing protein [Nocardioides sp. CER19]MDH2413284.1 DUF421 domain-containing protein [Nocardioides sp. CER19]
MWNDLVHLQIPLGEKVIRTVAVYVLIAAILRFVGKRDLAQLNSFDLVVMLLLSNVVQNAIIGPDNSLLGGAIGAVVLVAADGAVVRLIRRSDRLARLMEGTPTVLASDGRWDDRALREEGLRRADVDAALRRQNANDVSDLESLSIEPGGAIVATLRPEAQAATKADIARIEAKLDALLRQ